MKTKNGQHLHATAQKSESLSISFKTQKHKNHFQKHKHNTAKHQTQNPEKIPDYNNIEVYKLTCKTCNMSYIGQTCRELTQRYRERIRYIRNNDPQSAYAQNILRNQHEYGTITDTMTSLKPIHKTSLLIPCEQLFVQTYQYNGTLITEQNRGEQNPLFQLAIDTGLTSQLFHNK